MKTRLSRPRAAVAVAAALGIAASVAVPLALDGGPVVAGAARSAATATTQSPIKHLVVIYQENVSFDHYFGTYPDATNTSGQKFTAAAGTPSVNGLTNTLLTANPNGVNPHRFTPTNPQTVLTCDQNHDYTPEQYAFDGGKMDRFTAASGTATTTGTSSSGKTCTDATVMGYYDGNTVTGMWNYAQHFAMSDNNFGTTFGPSTPGAINVVSGDTGGVGKTAHTATNDGTTIGDGQGGTTLIGDVTPYYTDCVTTAAAVSMTGQNIGDQLNAKGLSWGWFEGGFTANTAYGGPANGPTTYVNGSQTSPAKCTSTHAIGTALGATTATHKYGTKATYIPHHEPFQYYASTANPHHLAPTSLTVVGTDTSTPGTFDKANHQYDVNTFNKLVSDIGAGTMSATHLPAVTYLKAPGYQDGHATYSDPLDEQQFVTSEVNALEKLPTWSSTAVVISYDDSDGFYDHVYSGVHNPSATSADQLTGTGTCGTGTPLAGEQGRCGYGPRLPLVVISPYAKQNYVSHTLTDQSSIVKFIEWNWNLGNITGSAANTAGSINGMFNFNNGGSTPAVQLTPTTGEVASVGTNPNNGYRMVGADGGVFAFGNAGFYGSMGGKPLNKPVVGTASTPDGQGYWEVAADGGVFSFGDAQFYGSMGGKPLNEPIVGIASTPDGQGYWEVAADGGVFAFGDAQFYGSEGGKPLNKPIVGIASTADGQGYWEVAADGGIFAFGDAQFYGSEGGQPLNKPVVGIAATASGNGYWLVASDGGIFSFGDASFQGSTGSLTLDKPIVGMVPSVAGNGYWLVAADGGVFAFGGSGYQGSLPALKVSVDNIVAGGSPL